MEINGKNLGRILNADLKEYKELYPNRKEKGYCACIDLVMLKNVKECLQLWMCWKKRKYDFLIQ